MVENLERGSAPEEDLDMSIMRRSIVAAALGNTVEWFDFGAYGFLATTLGTVFFPSASHTVSLLSAFVAFGVAFLMRPLGGFVLGPLGDRLGRRRILATTILLMSGVTFAIGLLPGFDSIGVLSPALLILCRLVQGFSTGGEYGGAATFVTEQAPTRRRGFITSWLEFSSLVGFALGASVATGLTASLPDAAMASWGWRVPFLLAGPLGIIGLYLRLRIEETPRFKELTQVRQVARAPLRESLARNRGGILRVLAIGPMANSGQYMLFTYMPSYLSSDKSLGLSATTSLMVVLVAIVFMLIVITGIGALSDRIGRKPVMLTSGVGLILFTYPIFMLISAGSWPPIVAGLLLLAALVVMNQAVLPSTLAAFFPTRTRYSGLSAGYNLGVAVFGGTTPFIATFLTSVTGNGLAPAFYLMATATMAVIALTRSPESAGVPLRQT